MDQPQTATTGAPVNPSPTPKSSSQSLSSLNKPIMIIAVVLLLAIFTAFAYLWTLSQRVTKQSEQTETISPTVSTQTQEVEDVLSVDVGDIEEDFQEIQQDLNQL